MIQHITKPFVYISGGITGLPNGNRQAFKDMEDKLFKLGFNAINPRNSSWPKYLAFDNEAEAKEGYNILMRKAIIELMESDAAVFLNGWKNSKGASEEYRLAKLVGIPCYDEDMNEI